MEHHCTKFWSISIHRFASVVDYAIRSMVDNAIKSSRTWSYLNGFASVENTRTVTAAPLSTFGNVGARLFFLAELLEATNYFSKRNRLAKESYIKVWGRWKHPLLSLANVAMPSILGKDLVKTLDPKVGPLGVNEALAVVLVAFPAVRCVSLEGKNRPNMTDVVLNLERALAICNGN
ncbi:hypothetical protein VNO78_21164 [Psophocarpus tetragonolobus]|uniref:Uncharacterized protein n=1 Tax=Psophocarpus tetragonolobus TaxID=3891 RepID=A0AAN9SEQ3_PSOTE